MSSAYIEPETANAGGNPQPGGRNAYRFSTPRVQVDPAPAPIMPSSAQTAPPRPRQRGRILIALLMLMACSAGIATVWDSLLRYQAYGVVTGRIIDVGVPMDGILESVNVAEGEFVRQDTRLATVADLEFEHELARVSDELRVTEAALQAEIAKVQWQSQVEETEMTRSIAELFESASRMHDESGALELLRYNLELNRNLRLLDASSKRELQSYEIQERAKREEIGSIEQAIAVLKSRAEKAVSSPRLGAEQIQPMISKSEMLLNEISRLRAKIDQGHLRSPVNGTILRRHRPAGECVKSHDTLFSVLEESSMEIELFLPQHLTEDYKVGDTIQVRIDPIRELVPCEIVRIGVEQREPPAHIEVFYRTNVRLLPVYLKPVSTYADVSKLSIGSVAKLPHFYETL